MNRNILKLLLIISLVVFSCKNRESQTVDGGATKEEENIAMETKKLFNPEELSEEPQFDIETTMGTIRIKLYKETPLHRDNFVKLASEEFFTGIRFHRVIKGFMIQTGDPLSKDVANESRFGTGGPGYNIPAEIVEGFTHKKGAVAAARRGDAANPQKESSGSQFYIVESPENCIHLDGDYSIFGETVKGFDVIDKIATTPTKPGDRPLDDIIILSVKPVI